MRTIKYLNKINLSVPIGMAMIFLLSCKKDPGNYTYHTINEAMVTGLDSMYVINKGERLTIAPKIKYTQDEVGDAINYRYQWILVNREGYGVGSLPTLDSGRVFSKPVDLLTGIYNMLYRITDKRTGVWKEYPFKLFVTLKTYEGWLTLSEIAGGQSRLDMMSYNGVSKDYVPLIDVLSIMKSEVKLTGLPNFVCFNNMNLGPTTNGTNDKIMVSSAKSAVFIGADTLNHFPLNDLGNFMAGPDKATTAGARLEGASLTAYLTVNGNVYYTGSGLNTFKFGTINKLNSTGQQFRAASFVSFTERDAIVFDESNSRFLWRLDANNGFYVFDVPALNNLNANLLFMARTSYNGGETFAVLKDKTNGKVYLVRLTSSKLNYFQEITGTTIAAAENIAINNEYGYVFYSIGGKVYEYDFSLGLNKEMADYGTRKISLLKFQDVQRGSTSNTERYNKMRNQLIVCSYDQGNLDSSGEMDIYNVPGINAQITKAWTFSGLGKVVSVTYRTR